MFLTKLPTTDKTWREAWANADDDKRTLAGIRLAEKMGITGVYSQEFFKQFFLCYADEREDSVWMLLNEPAPAANPYGFDYALADDKNLASKVEPTTPSHKDD